MWLYVTVTCSSKPELFCSCYRLSACVILGSRGSQSTWTMWFVKLTGMLEEQSDNSRDAWGPVSPIPSALFSVQALSMLWLSGGTSLLLYGLLPAFLQNLKLPSELPCSWNLEWMRWYHRERILQKLCSLAHASQRTFCLGRDNARKKVSDTIGFNAGVLFYL